MKTRNNSKKSKSSPKQSGKGGRNVLTLEQRRKGGRNRKGKRNKKTIVKQLLGIANIEDLKPEVLYNWKKLLTNRRSTKYVFLSTKEVSKYLFPQFREHKVDVPGVINFIVEPSIAGPAKPQNPSDNS